MLTKLATPVSIALCLASLCSFPGNARALGGVSYVTDAADPTTFELVSTSRAVPLDVDAQDWPGVTRTVADLSEDIQRVTGQQPLVMHGSGAPLHGDVVLIGTIGKSPIIDDLIRRHKLDVTGVAGKWEAAVTTIVERPMPGVSRALVIAGSDKRGTIFGVYDLSEQIGVSPWYWWADVRIPHRNALYVQPGPHIQQQPAVKYRGIFLNDEAPALSGWVNEKFGGYNSKFYVHVFELLLRLKANFLWPAMWNSSFAADDPLNAKLADEFGIVMGTSHEEPMMRAEKEWKSSDGPWDYATNANGIRAFWKSGMERDHAYEQVVTLGMRGVNDTAMSSSTNTEQLEKIVADQRQILKETVNPNLNKVPQVWCLYKEVQTYYVKGMRVPDDVTLLWSDDNWGNLRRLPTVQERQRPGGAGIYYHFDYVGGPRSYKWLNTVSIPKVWEQMNLALNYGADRIWVVNVGDLKPLEYPIEFFLSMAHSPERWGKDNLKEFAQLWATREFGKEHAIEIAAAMDDYTRYNGRRKPEQLDPSTFSLTSFSEADQVDADWRSLTARVDKLAAEMPEAERASFFELVQYPVDASATVAEMYIAAGRNALDARLGRAVANASADETEALFARDAALTGEYNHNLLDGRWDHMMDQTHIGYTSWQEPPLNAMPAVTRVQVPREGSLTVSVGGPGFRPSLGTLDSVARQVRSIKLYNRGQSPVNYTVSASEPWIMLSRKAGTVAQQDAVEVQIDWAKAPGGLGKAFVEILPEGGSPIRLPLQSLRIPGITRENLLGFAESDGYVAIEAADTTQRSSDGETHWEELPGYGETRSAMTIFPVLAASKLDSSASLSYRMYLSDQGQFTLLATLAPTSNFVPGRGLRFAVSIDDGPRTVVDALEHNSQRDWEQAVSDGVRKITVPLSLADSGYHILHIWAVDPGVVLERIVLSHGALPPSYLGPSESFHGTSNQSAVAALSSASVNK